MNREPIGTGAKKVARGSTGPGTSATGNTVIRHRKVGRPHAAVLARGARISYRRYGVWLDVINGGDNRLETPAGSPTLLLAIRYC